MPEPWEPWSPQADDRIFPAAASHRHWSKLMADSFFRLKEPIAEVDEGAFLAILIVENA